MSCPTIVGSNGATGISQARQGLEEEYSKVQALKERSIV